MPSSLKDFYLNNVMKNDVKIYLTEFLKDIAVEKVFNREDTSGVSEANELIEKAFSNLDILFSPKSEEKEIKNEAR